MTARLVTEVETLGSVLAGGRQRKIPVHVNEIMAAAVYPDRIELILTDAATVIIHQDLSNDRLRIKRKSGILKDFINSSDKIARFEGRDGSEVFVQMGYRERRNPLARVLTPRTRIHFANGKATGPLVMPKMKRGLVSGLKKLRRLSYIAG